MPRYDISEVRPQGAYVARQCPVRAQNNVLRPCQPADATPDLQRRFDRGRDFEDVAVTDLETAAGGVVATTAGSEEELEALTVEAIRQRSAVIIGGRLPTDHVGKRVGKPDLLVIADGGGYRPVDIKHHRALEAAGSGASALPALCSSMQEPKLENAVADDRFRARKRESDLLQLAHYQHMLEAAALAPTDGRWGGIIGAEQRIVWYDLDAPVWLTPSSSGKQKLRSTIERYDVEFDFRLDVIAVAEAHVKDPSVELLAVPALIGECPTCPWRDHCGERLALGSGDVSLVPRVGWRQRAIHVAHGVSDREALARLDSRTARLLALGVNIPEMRSLIEGLPSDTPVVDLGVVVHSKKQLAALVAEGVRTFGDLASLPATTASYGHAMPTLPEQIDLARAALGPAPIYRRRGVHELLVPRADVEIDRDMENIEEGVYLWGALVTTRANGAVSSSYKPFATWKTMTPSVEAENSLRFWAWLTGTRNEAERDGCTLTAYCYNASAENQYLRRLGLAGGILDEVEAFIGSEQWVDLLKVVSKQLITGGGLGLKKIAPLGGFSWPVEDPGGGTSMIYYDTAVRSADRPERNEARAWLLEYNRGDVEATLAIRDWLETMGHSIPPIEQTDALFSTEASDHTPQQTTT